MDDGTVFHDEPEEDGIILVFAIVLVFFMFIGMAFFAGMQWQERNERSACEQSVVTSIQSGKPFMIYNGMPVMLYSTVRQDLSKVYSTKCASCHRRSTT